MKDKKMYILLVISILFAVVGVSLAFFSLNIIGNDTAKYNKITTGDLELVFTDDNEVSLDGAFPGDSITKTISVKNTGTKEVSYNIVWQELENKIIKNELVLEATCKRINNDGIVESTCNNIEETPIRVRTIEKNISIGPKVTHEYTIKITFKDTASNQNYNKRKSFSGKIGIEEYFDNTIYCNTNVELTPGTEYINGQYTYRYKQEGYVHSQLNGSNVEIIYEWNDLNEDGWGVILTDKESTEPINTPLCTYINDIPVVSTAYMFYYEKATEIDLSNFNTTNITNMSHMFDASRATSLDLSRFDTSSVTNMSQMFLGSHATTLDLSNFNTSNVKDMNGMFNMCQATTINVNNFDLSSIDSMEGMFTNAKATNISLKNIDTSNITSMRATFFGTQNLESIDLSYFDTSNVTDMYMMFQSTNLTTLDVSNFNTSNVTNMMRMFASTKLTSLDLSNFDTSNVTDMNAMFSGNSEITSLDISNFDTSNVTNMSGLFAWNTNLKTIYVSNKFNSDNVPQENSQNMFLNCNNLVGGKGTTFDSTKIDKTYAKIDGGTSNPGYFTAK